MPDTCSICHQSFAQCECFQVDPATAPSLSRTRLGDWPQDHARHAPDRFADDPPTGPNYHSVADRDVVWHGGSGHKLIGTDGSGIECYRCGMVADGSAWQELLPDCFGPDRGEDHHWIARDDRTNECAYGDRGASAEGMSGPHGPCRRDSETPIVEYPERRHPPINGCTINGYHPCKLGTPAASRPVVPYGGSDPWAGGELAARIRRAQDRMVDR